MEGFTTQTLETRLLYKARILTNLNVKLCALSNSYYDFMFPTEILSRLQLSGAQIGLQSWDKIYSSKAPKSILILGLDADE